MSFRRKEKGLCNSFIKWLLRNNAQFSARSCIGFIPVNADNENLQNEWISQKLIYFCTTIEQLFIFTIE